MFFNAAADQQREASFRRDHPRDGEVRCAQQPLVLPQLTFRTTGSDQHVEVGPPDRLAVRARMQLLRHQAFHDDQEA
jgi:hypothetical protein